LMPPMMKQLSLFTFAIAEFNCKYLDIGRNCDLNFAPR